MGSQRYENLFVSLQQLHDVGRNHGNELSGSIKCWEVLEQLHNWRLLKKGYWVFGLCPSSGFFLKTMKRRHNISETGSVSVLR
jgi:hypothetical protein